MTYPFLVDGIAYNVTVPEGGIHRSFSVLDGENVGRSIAGGMIRDVIGTFYNYSMDILPRNDDRESYDELYEVLSAPVDKHTLTVPYGQSWLTFEGYITGGEDDLISMQHGNQWGGMTLKFVAMEPARRPI